MIEPGDNPDLSEERLKATFNVESLAAFVHGGVEKLRRRRQIAAFVDSRPEFRDPQPVEFMTRPERIDNAARKIVELTKHSDQIDVSDYAEAMYLQSLVMGRDGHPLSLHYIMFLPTIQGQMDDEQTDKWLPLTLSRAIIGTYAQTELGHGTNLRKLETTATYDPTHQQFIINTPTITATKWWPGCLGKSSNYAFVVAQLYTGGVCYGPHPFLVQLRDLDTHKPLAGIQVGDIGPKFGANSNDNGFLRLDNVRIPRTNMPMRYSKVLPSGEYVKPTHKKLGYGTMVYVRAAMVRDQALFLGMAATVAIRYSAVRRQGEIIPGEGEVKVLDYQTQQYRILPALARAYAFLFSGFQVRDMYTKVTEQLKSSNNADLLPELHALSSGLKAIVSWEVARGIEQCRLSCGGHGYSAASGLPELYALAVGGCTYEGDNIVMLLQLARFLVKGAEQVRSGNGHRCAELTEYLTRAPSGGGASRSRFDQSTADSDIFDAFEHLARRRVFAVYDQLQRLQSVGLSAESAWNKAGVELCKASRAHVRLSIVRTFAASLQSNNDAAVQSVLHDLFRLYSLNELMDCSTSLVQDGYLSSQQLEYIQHNFYLTLDKLRPNAVALVDAFDFRDRELSSVLGRRDGNVYPNLLEWARRSELNKTDVLQTYHDHLGPMMKSARNSKL